MSYMCKRAHTWPVEMDAPLRRARMSPDRCSILTTLTGTSNLLTYCSNGRFRKSDTRKTHLKLISRTHQKMNYSGLFFFMSVWAFCTHSASNVNSHKVRSCCLAMTGRGWLRVITQCNPSGWQIKDLISPKQGLPALQRVEQHTQRLD